MNAPSRGRVEKPAEIVNVPWQTREREPTEFENRVGDALEKAFGEGAESLAEVLSHFQRMNFRAEDGAPWTEESLQAWLRRRA